VKINVDGIPNIISRVEMLTNNYELTFKDVKDFPDLQSAPLNTVPLDRL
jgi:hypothetical protein